MNNNTDFSWTDAIGKQLIKGVELKIAGASIRQTQNKCIKCNKIFIYNHSDDTEIVHRILYFNKTGNLDVCLGCDKKNKKTDP